MIQCQDISLKFESKTIFSNFNLFVKKNEKICLKAASGRGKSTLLKLIQGFVSLDSGSVLIDGMRLERQNINPIRERIAWVPQNINLPVEDGNGLLRMLKIYDRKNEVVKKALQLGLDDTIMDYSFVKLSGGQKQRMIIAACLSMNKKILIMDEPTSSLDEDAIHLLLDEVLKLDEVTMVSASHNSTWQSKMDRLIEL
ncbi:ABC transporter ATP-binding protein [Aureibacter tunicatorum]|uniref:Polar amino acid transport system ATP-binding protein/putative ABC transport system ATP-binding protein n=1 Tax=Aureibacter tunicatorum TaxID=866807 RepID=A0AAE4BV39_9BACT|nr:ATP-binding cassette domain-containing protein [Aureibacter tunicatorum]MDR6241690.1 polar amino acid transport system ATP-binding protein/putative ABC transport system ATP-binding protein [Aureibacter tunicatorum]BDD07324.1 ABC transporter ATP-binding protein [Aureibacter tunicatorum]